MKDKYCKHCGKILIRKRVEPKYKEIARIYCDKKCLKNHLRSDNFIKVVKMIPLMKTREIADRLGISHQRVSQIAKRADKDGLINLREITLPRKRNAIKIADLNNPLKHCLI